MTTKTSSHSKKKSQTDGNYDKPELRKKLKEEIKAGDKGGKSGQWSARKAQLLTHKYEEAGGGYLSNERTDSQKHLENWTDEQWQTSDGKPAERAGGTTRYLPKEAWDKLSPEEKKATNGKKQAGSRSGKQVVANTEKAKNARKQASK
jgi:hypothetical protein